MSVASTGPTSRLKRGRPLLRCVSLTLAAFVSIATPTTPGYLSAQDVQSDADQRALELYADAANLQNGGALAPAIETWAKFLDQFPDHEKAAEAAHYLGVCHMQTDPPDPAAAVTAFKKSVKDPNSTVREQSLANLGWCHFWTYQTRVDQADVESIPDDPNLNRTIKVFETLIKEFPQSEYADRAFYYSGEAAAARGDDAAALTFFNRVINLDNFDASSFRCDTIYGQAFALENLGRDEDAATAYRRWLDKCGDDDPATAAVVHTRLGDWAIADERFDDAIEQFNQTIALGGDPANDTAGISVPDEDIAYAWLRKAAALAKSDRAADATDAYETLLDQYPDSDFAKAARLDAGRSAYRAGLKLQARGHFEAIVQSGGDQVVTEAAYWLTRLAIDDDDSTDAEAVARKYLPTAAGPFASRLHFALAQAVVTDEDRIGESVDIYLEAARTDPDASLAPRAIYNAAFSAYQSDQPERAIKITGRFVESYPEDDLLPEILLIRGESLASAGRGDEALAAFDKLLDVAPEDAESRDGWILRSASIAGRFGNHQKVIDILTPALDQLGDADRAAARFTLGTAMLDLGRTQDAAEMLESAASNLDDPERIEEATLLAADAYLRFGEPDSDAARRGRKLLESLADAESNSPMIEQARIKLATLRRRDDDHRGAADLLTAVVDDNQNPAVMPYALFGLADAQTSLGDDADAAQTLTRLIDDFPKHPLAAQARLDRGLALAAAGDDEAARKDLESFVASGAQGVPLGDALFELAVMDQSAGRPADAIEKFRRIQNEVADFPDPDDLAYRLGWAAYADEQFDVAAEAFKRVVGSTGPAQAADGGVDENAKLSPRQLSALAMTGEAEFRSGNYKASMTWFEPFRDRVTQNDYTADNLPGDLSSRLVELALLHGGQSAAQLDDHPTALEYFDQLRTRFPRTRYLPQVFYEMGASHQASGNADRALKLFDQVASNYRNTSAARARFMRGEIYFEQRQLENAIAEFQKVMFGFGADRAPEAIKSWQARSGYEAARSSELLASMAKTESARQRALQFAEKFYRYVVQKHPDDRWAKPAAERLEELK